MKITGGKARGTRLSSSHKTDIRPASDQMRQAVFSSLGQDCSDYRVLDLFAGTGSYGLEALSRGATSAHFIEKHPLHHGLIKENLAKVSKSAQCEASTSRILKMDALKWLRSASASYHLIFIDPPYPLIPKIWKELTSKLSTLLASPHSKIIIEMPGDFPGNHPQLELLKHLGSQRAQEPSCRIYSSSK